MSKLIYGLLSRLKKISIILFILIWGSLAFGQKTPAGFTQRIEWNADKNAFEYKVEIRQNGKAVKTFTTENNYIVFSLPSGSYEYQVSVYDFLGRLQDKSTWQSFEIAKASKPMFENVRTEIEIDTFAENTIVLPLELENVASETSVTLVNTKTGEKFSGNLFMKNLSEGISETGSAEAIFSKVPVGDYTLVVENPSGLKAESPVITIKAKDWLSEYEARIRAEKEALEKARREAIELSNRRLEEQRARNLAEQEERARREAEERALLEENAIEEPEPLEEEIKKTPAKILGIEAKVGAALELSLFEDDILSRKNYDWLLKQDGFEKTNLTPYAAISFVPDLHWFINPGIELSANAFIYEYHAAPFNSSAPEYIQRFMISSVQINIVGQMRVHPQKFFVNIKAGGGLSDIYMKTEYNGTRAEVQHHYLYPKINAGLSVEYIPFKHFVLEAGADFNKILSSKVNVSYLLPYAVLGVRF